MAVTQEIRMTRLSKLLFAATALVAAPIHAYADGDPPADGTGGGGDGTGGGAGAGGGAAMTPPAGGENEAMAAWSKSVIDRPLTVLKGKLGAEADLLIAHVSITILGMTASATSEGLGVGAAYGVSDKLEVGGSYAFALHEFEIKGPLTLFGAFSLMHSAKLDVGASADIVIRLGDTTTETIEAGLGVRYKVTPKVALFTGSPWAPGPLGQHLKIGLQSGAAKTFDIPVGVGLQATPELFAYVETNVATILLSDPGMGKRVTSIADFTPLTIGAWFNVNKNIDVGGSFNFLDVQHAGDFYTIALGARYFN